MIYRLALLLALCSCFSAQAAVVKLVQSGSTTSNGGGIVSVDVASVDMTKSFLVFSIRNDSNRPTGSSVRGELTTSTKIDFFRESTESSVVNIQWYLVEFESGVRVQRGDFYQNAANTYFPPPLPIIDHNKAILLTSKTAQEDDVNYDSGDSLFSWIAPSSPTQLQFVAGSAYAAHRIHWQLIEFTDGSATSQTDYSSFYLSSSTTVNVSLASSVNTSKTMLISDGFSYSDGPDIGERLYTARVKDASTIEFKRSVGGDDNIYNISYTAMSFTDATTVQTGTASFATAETTKNVTLTALNLGKSIALSSVQGSGGQALGRTNKINDDVVGETAFTFTLTSPTNLQIQRNASSSASAVQWQVVDFGGTASPACGSPSVGLKLSTYTNSFGGVHPNNAAEYQTRINSTAVAAKLIGSGVVTNVSGTGNPYGSNDSFLAVFSGYIYAPSDGVYQFGVDGDDAVELLIDGAVISGFYGGHAKTNSAQNIQNLNLKTGYHTFEFRHEEGNGDESYYAYWKKPSDGGLSIMPSSAFRYCGASTGATETACQRALPTAISASNINVNVKLKDNGVIINNPGNELAVHSISDNHSGSCSSGTCASSGNIPTESLSFPAFQYASGGPSYGISSSTFIGGSGITDYQTIEVSGGRTLSFWDTNPVYRIKKLEMKGDNATVRFSPGDYFIEEFKTDSKKFKIEVLGTGTARIWSKKDIKFKEDALINSPSYGVTGAVSKLFLHTTKHFHAEKDSTTSAIIVGEEDFKVQNTARVFGAGSSSKTLELKDSGRLTYDYAAIADTDFNGACDNTPPAPPIHHFVVGHDQNAYACVVEPISVTAKDSGNATLTDFVDGTTLNTESGKGTWSLASGAGSFSDGVANDGVATYTFAAADNGVASFNLSYLEGASPIDVDVYLTSNTGIRDDDTEGTLSFSPSGFTITQSKLPNPPPGSINDPITDKISGNNFTAHIAAYGQTPTNPTCGVIESYAGNKSIKFWVDHENPSSGTLTPLVNGTSTGASEVAAVAKIVNFVDGQASVTVKYKDVGLIQLHGKDGSINGNSNEFVSKPADIVITEITTSGSMNNPAASSVTGTKFVKAGESFYVTAEVRDSEGDRTPNYGNELSAEGIELSASSLVLPAGGRNGSSNNGNMANNTSFSDFGPGGRFRNTTTSWDEVGVIKLRASVADDNYLGSGDLNGSETGNVGRFYAASFNLQSSHVSGFCNNMAYMGQNAITLSYEARALGVAGNTLYNYDLGLLGSGAVASPVWSAENGNGGVNLATRITPLSSSWSHGVYQRGFHNVTFTRLAAADGPFDNLQIALALANSDAVPLSGLNVNAATASNCSTVGNCDAKALSNSVIIRYGRLEVTPAFGPETEALDIKLTARYYSGTNGFVTNTLDDCTDYTKSQASLSDYTGGLPAQTITQPTAVKLVVDGKSQPGDALLLSVPGAGNTGSLKLTFNAASWLEFDWLGGGNTDPSAPVTFGQFRGHDRVLYWRELSK